MTADQSIKYIRDAVRKVFPPTAPIEFSGSRSGHRGEITHIRIDAWIGTERLLYEHDQLLRVLEADSVESDGDEYAFFAGTVNGVHYELRLFAEPQAVSSR
jgi:hypothetical protein